MVDMTRRAALRIGGGAGLGGLLAGAGVVQPPLAVPGLNGAAGTPAVPEGYSGGLAQRAAQALMGRHDRRRQLRIDGLDPSLAALRSVSPAIKCLIQAKRDDDSDNWLRRVQKKAWS